jgi:site-specific recombinase XerD
LSLLGNVSPDFAGDAQRILSIPCKRSVRTVLGFLSLNEVEFLLAAIDESKWTGRRDYLLFSLPYNTGARISDVLQLTPADTQQRVVRLPPADIGLKTVQSQIMALTKFTSCLAALMIILNQSRGLLRATSAPFLFNLFFHAHKTSHFSAQSFEMGFSGRLRSILP